MAQANPIEDPIVRSHYSPPMGAELTREGVIFRVWAPLASEVVLELAEGGIRETVAMAPEGDGAHSAFVRGGRAGALYQFRIDGGRLLPDPCSRSQPQGVHGPSEVVDPSFPWRDAGWRGIDQTRLVIYECHAGTYTPEGSFDALVPQLRELKRLGITALELMPVAEFPGKHNWGYDGVDLFAPSQTYGGAAGLRRLVEAAHLHGIGVILDVVYNHLGPDGNYLREFSPYYFTNRHSTPWGDALNFDGPNASWVRDFIIQNACYWLTEYHIDGLRLDATHAMIDDSTPHILAELAQRARASVSSDRHVLIMAENDANDVRLIRPVADGGFGLDAVWADDFHHSLRVLLTATREGYFGDYEGTAREISTVVSSGFLYQGQVSPRLRVPRGSRVTDEPASSFVFCLENHDQVGNQPFGQRLNHLLDRDRYAVASTLLLSAPQVPLLFMGQEFAASSPFLYFTDHHPELGRLVTAGRREEFSYMEGFTDPVLRQSVPDPQSPDTFRRSRLRLEEREEHAPVYRLYSELLRLRRTDPVLSLPDRSSTSARAVGDRMIAVLWKSAAGRRLVLANFGVETVQPVESLVPGDWPRSSWKSLFSSNASRFGGSGQRTSFSGSRSTRVIKVPASCAVIFEVPG